MSRQTRADSGKCGAPGVPWLAAIEGCTASMLHWSVPVPANDIILASATSAGGVSEARRGHMCPSGHQCHRT